jgi:hypothetical protein
MVTTTPAATAPLAFAPAVNSFPSNTLLVLGFLATIFFFIGGGLAFFFLGGGGGTFFLGGGGGGTFFLGGGRIAAPEGATSF